MASAANGAVIIKPHKKLFLQEKDEEALLLPGEVELNPLFLSSYATTTDYDQIKQLKLVDKNIAKCESLGFVQFLERLEISKNKLKNINFLEDNKDLRYLDVSNNLITSLDPLKNLSKLQVLKCAHNQLKTIGMEVLSPSAEHLKAIILNNNELRSLPRAEEAFKNVNTIVVSHNEISTLQNIQMYPNLKKLSASNNSLRSLPNEIRKLSGLMELRLAHNKIISLPDSISYNANLHILILNHNLINSFDDIKRLSGCKDLRELDLSNNPIQRQKDYHEKVLQILPNLQILDGKITDVGESKKKKKNSDQPVANKVIKFNQKTEEPTSDKKISAETTTTTTIATKQQQNENTAMDVPETTTTKTEKKQHQQNENTTEKPNPKNAN